MITRSNYRKPLLPLGVCNAVHTSPIIIPEMSFWRFVPVSFPSCMRLGTRPARLGIQSTSGVFYCKTDMRHRRFSEVAAPCTCLDRQPRGVTLSRFRRTLSIWLECYRIVLFDSSLLSGQSCWRGEARGRSLAEHACIRLNLPELTVGTVAPKKREFWRLNGTMTNWGQKIIMAHIGLVRYALFWLGMRPTTFYS